MGEAIAEVGYLAGLCGHTGTAWQKQGILWGYNDTVSEEVENTNLAAGYNQLLGTLVPSGEVWVITGASIRYTGTSPTSIVLAAFIGAVGIVYVVQATPTSGLWYPCVITAILKGDDQMRAEVFGATATDDFVMRYAGYKMRLDL